MELKALFNIFVENQLKIILIAVFGVVIGICAYFFLPTRYIASGTLFVARGTERPSNEEFSYEGYYAYQASRGHAETVAGLLESADIRHKSLIALDLEPTGEALRKLGRMSTVKKNADQLVSLEVRASSVDEAKKVWGTLIEQTLIVIDSFADPLLRVNTINTEPVVKEVYKNVYLNGILGFAFGFMFAYSFFVFKKYLE